MGWTEKFVVWSPLGTYLLTVSERGVLLWGGNGFQMLQKFAHSNVQLVDFSPGERYLCTWSPEGMDGEENLQIWDVKTGEVKRGFPTSREQPAWPMMHWSADEKTVMRQNAEDGSIQCFQLPSMQPACKRIKYEGATGACFSPKDSIVCFWMKEKDQNPARVCLLEVPSRKEIRSKILFNVAQCRFFWHPSGEYLCVQVDRHSKSKKTIYTNFELFRVTAKDVPVEVLEFKDQVHAFAWEPNGCCFVVLHGEPPRIDVSFYTMGAEADKKVGVPLQCEKITTLEKKGVNEVRWSPRGNSLILAGLRNLNGGMWIRWKWCNKMSTSWPLILTGIQLAGLWLLQLVRGGTLWRTDTWCGVCSAKRSTQFKRLSSGSSCGAHDQSPSSPRKTKIPLSKTGRPGRPNSMPRISKLVNLLLMKRGRSASD